MNTKSNRYLAIIEAVFLYRHVQGNDRVDFERSDLERAAKKLKVALPKNIGDVIYSFRYRNELPASIVAAAPKSKTWIIEPNGRGRYSFVAVAAGSDRFEPTPSLMRVRIPDATPGVVASYAMSDEQALLARLRYNRLLDIFTGLTCYSLQSHLRTNVKGKGQIEVDELYIGIDRFGSHTTIPVQAKGGTDLLGPVQVLQDVAMCSSKFPKLACRPVGAQFLADHTIVLFEFALTSDGPRIVQERHYRLVPGEKITADELSLYRKLAGG